MVVVPGKVKDQASSAGSLDTSYTVSAPSNGTPFRRSSFDEIVKHGMPFAELILASAIRDVARASRYVKQWLMINVIAR